MDVSSDRFLEAMEAIAEALTLQAKASLKMCQLSERQVAASEQLAQSNAILESMLANQTRQ